MLQQWTYAPQNTAAAKVQRQATRMRRGARALVAPDRPVVCFTFDDFPKAALNGADIVEKHGGKAGFYACTSWMGKRSPITGEMFDAATLQDLRVRRDAGALPAAGPSPPQCWRGHRSTAAASTAPLRRRVRARSSARVRAGPWETDAMLQLRPRAP